MPQSKLLTSLVLGLLAGCVWAQDGASAAKSVEKQMAPLRYKDSGTSFYSDKARGWHWYEDPLADEEEVMEQPAPAPTQPKEQKREDAKVPTAPAGPAPLSSEWLKDNLPKYAGRAIDNPTDTNVKAYLYLQRYAMDKATNYATASQRVTAGDPYLDSNVRRPISDIGGRAADEEGVKVRDRVMDQLRKTTGILFYFRGDCQFCHKQWPLLKWFSEKYKFPVIPVTLDGAILDGMDPKMVQMNRGQAEMMGVSVVPSMYLLQPPNKFGVVSHGITASEGFPDLVVQAAMSAGLIDEKVFMETRGVKDMTIRSALAEDVTPEIVANPVKLVEYMKKKLKDQR